MNFLGLDLSDIPIENLSDWKVYIIPVLYVITSFISMKQRLLKALPSMKKMKQQNPEAGKPKEIGLPISKGFRLFLLNTG